MVGRKSCIIAHQIKEETHQRCRKNARYMPQ